jgi:phosphoglycerate kinase
VAGFLLEKEIAFLGGAVENPQRRSWLFWAGPRSQTRSPVIENLLGKADALLIGGACLITFLKAKGYEMADSLVEAGLRGVGQGNQSPRAAASCSYRWTWS